MNQILELIGLFILQSLLIFAIDAVLDAVLNTPA